MKNLAGSLAEVRRIIIEIEQKYQRNPGSVTLLAVSKKQSVNDIREAFKAGQMEFGENYLQEAVEKITELNNPGIIWHYIGPVQSNKSRQISELFQWVHSVDRKKIARRLNDHRPDHMQPLNICIQINISNEQSKSGSSLDELEDLAGFCFELPRIKLRGLMALPEPCTELEKQRVPYRLLHDTFTRLQSAYSTLDTLSMGTSIDMEAAIAEGTTMVRIGTAIFGKRQ